MGSLRGLGVSQQIGLLFVALFGLLVIVSLISFVRTLRERGDVQMAEQEQFNRDLRAVWVGAVLFWLERSPNELLRLLIVTGLLGGFTTFSAFSAESLILLQRGQLVLALAHTLAHVVGALACAALGFRIAQAALLR